MHIYLATTLQPLLGHSKSFGPSAPIAYATSVSPPNEAIAWPRCKYPMDDKAAAWPGCRYPMDDEDVAWPWCRYPMDDEAAAWLCARVLGAG